MLKEGRGNGLKIAIVFLVLVLVVIILLVPAVQNVIANFLLSPFQEKAPKYAIYSVERTMTVDANGGSITSLTLDAPLPMDVEGTGYSLQSVESMSASPMGVQSLRHGDDWMVWSHGALLGTQVYQVHETFEFRVDTHKWEITEQSSGSVADVPPALRNVYLHSEWLSDDGWMVDINHQNIQQKAQEIVGQEQNVYVILDRIYDWMVKNVQYPSSNQPGLPKTSMQTLSSMVGDCDDQSMLFCSLARASGVPAWIQLGALYDKDKDEWFGHGWVQACVPLKEGGSESVVIDTVNRDFLLWMPNRLAEYTDDGNGDHLSDYYYYFNCYYDEQSYPPGQGPENSKAYRSLAHQESGETIDVGSLLETMPPFSEAMACPDRVILEAP